MQASLGIFSFEDFFQGTDPETPLFVNMGGGIGQYALSLREKFPTLRGRIIVQE